MAAKYSCVVCKESYSVKYGTVCSNVSTVPLFKETKRKEIIGKEGRPVSVATLLQEIGISVHENQSASLCTKCARKISSCHRSYLEVTKALQDTGTRESGSPAYHVIEKRPRVISSPSGLTPNTKRARNTTTVRQPAPSLRKSLFSSDEGQKRNQTDASLERDEITQLMSLPVENGGKERESTIVKVGFLTNAVNTPFCELREQNARTYYLFNIK